MPVAGSAEEVQDFLRVNVVPKRRAEPRLAPALASVESQIVPSPQGKLAAWRVGEGPAVLLVHGWEDDNSLWAPLIDALVERDRAVVVFDLPAHGFSAGEWGLGPQAADGIAAVVAAMGPVDAVVAHSFAAGGVILAMSEGGLAVDRMVLIAPPLRAGNRWLRYAERLGVSEDVAFAAQAIYEDRIGPARASFDFRAELTEIDVDLLVIHSADDERFPLGGSQEVVPKCRRGELVVVQGLDHRRTARDPEVVARIAEFVSDDESTS
jgi:pimeloyl-ACP methyl ester carboxylesterase